MATRVEYSPTFRARFKRLARKYPSLVEQIEALVSQLENDDRPGNRLTGTRSAVYKVRMGNPSAGKGKSGGFRAIYYAQMATEVYLLTVYAKTQKENISRREVERLLVEIGLTR